ncbi:PP2C family protein-serine/threonine phosphatase [Kineococcus glutinatus]|uniref:HAMP domain-containing protein n=1 Tax=Kineococcus glutinatus TaxID=1070872 RepID=A0ABP9H607_9ACTN
MTLQTRVSALAAVVLVLGVVLLGVVVTGQSRDGELNARLDSWRALLHRQDEVSDALARWHHAQRDYLVTGSAQRLADSERHRAAMDAALDALSAELPADEPEIRVATGHMIAEILAVKITTDPEVAARSREDRDEAGRLVRIRADAPGLDRVLDAAERVQRLTEEGQRDAIAASRDAADQLQVQQGVVAGLALLLVPTVLLLVRRWILLPLSRTRERLLRVSSGDLQVPVEVDGPPELADVAAAAEAMRRRILDELAASVASREALEQGEPLVVEVRAQLEPHPAPRVPGWTSAAALRPAEGVLAGDWYDVIALPDGSLAALVADVSGHGARAGIVAMQVKRALESSLHLDPRPHVALGVAARVFAEEAERFASCLVAVLDPASGVVRYANAGHPPPLVVAPGGDGGVRVVDSLDVTGPLLSWLHGDDPDAWHTGTVRLPAGAALLAFTDGLVEARPPAGGEELGVEGVVAVLHEVGDLAPQHVVDAVLEAARRHSGGRVRDDVTVIVLARTSAQVPPGDPAPLLAAPAETTRGIGAVPPRPRIAPGDRP